jgi:hypothetical protein
LINPPREPISGKQSTGQQGQATEVQKERAVYSFAPLAKRKKGKSELQVEKERENCLKGEVIK